MHWKKPGHEFDVLYGNMMDSSTEYRLWGAAELGHQFIEQFANKLHIVQVVDNDINKQGKQIDDLVIQAPNKLIYTENSFVVVTCSYYEENRPYIEEKGYVPFVNLLYYEDFYIIYEMYMNSYLKSKRVDISLTEKCTLQCKKCNMFMPYFKNPKNQLCDEVLSDIDAYFSVVDEVKVMNLLGGEPFLYPEILCVINYIGEKYRNRITNLIVFTNAMIVPTDEVCSAMKKYDVQVQISDYTSVVPYQKKLNEFYQKMDDYGINHYTFQLDTWGDFGFPENSNDLPEEQMEDFFNRCMAPFRGLWKKRVYFCHLETSAIRAGIYEDNADDYYMLLDSQGSDMKKLYMEFDYGYCRGGYISFCKVCRGCDCVNTLTVPAALQMERK